MASTYMVEDAQHKAPKPDKGYGPMQIIALALKDDSGEITRAEWYTKASTPVPTAGVQLTGDLIPNQFGGMNFKRAQQFPSGSGGGSKEYKADPAKQAAIAMESAQKSAVEIMRLAMDCKAWTPSQDGRPISEMTGVIKTIAQSLYAQITEVSEATK